VSLALMAGLFFRAGIAGDDTGGSWPPSWRPLSHWSVSGWPCDRGRAICRCHRAG